VSAGTLVLNYGATNVAPTQNNPSSPRRGDPIFKHTNGFGTNKNLAICPDGARNQEKTVLARASSNLLLCYAQSAHGMCVCGEGRLVSVHLLESPPEEGD
jgi:hypothetical protein